MGKARNLSKLSSVLTTDGAVPATKGGTGTTTGAASSSPTVTAVGYPGNDTAVNTSGGDTVTLTGTNFNTGVNVVINGTSASVVTRVSTTQLTFTAPAQATGSYIIYVVNTDGSTALAVPGLQYSPFPTWTTAAGTLGSYLKNQSFTTTLAVTGDAPITYSLYSGTLPSGITLNSSTGVLSGTTPNVTNDTTYSFVVRSTDAQNQDTDRAFSILVQPLVYMAATIEYLLVAGGGGGYSQAGGGGGGILSGSISPNTLAKTISYNIVVGAGGGNSTTGANSTIFSLTAVGGGSVPPAPGAGGPFSTNGGPSDDQHNAGGHGDWSSSANAINGGAATNGGTGGGKAGGGGGGGGTNYNPAGSGGAGATFTISGSSVTYAGGGGGAQSSTYQGAPGGAGGGGSGNWSSAGNSGGSGLGGGGGGSYQSSAGAGGSGIVIIRYPDSYPLAASTWYADVSTTGGYRIYKWTTSGSITF